MQNIYEIHSQPLANRKNVFIGIHYRICLLTSRLFRFEYSENGVFEDRPTQKVLFRNFPAVPHTVDETDNCLTIETDSMVLHYDKKADTPDGLSVTLKNGGSWHYGEQKSNLKGTCRTLDCTKGTCKLENGLMSRQGISILDDSDSLEIAEDGFVSPRKQKQDDFYFFGYGHEYLDCLKAFYSLCGKTPMLPRYALGNWWSRYYKYTEKTYKALVNKFDEERVPIAVAVIDMDWHWVDIDPKYGSGWTGYSWNTDFFPDPDGFLKWLHDRGMKVSLNVHPADGVRAFEEMYVDMAQALGVDYKNEEPISFDISDPRFLEAYFKYIHHYYEKRGVDFWWIDWQQGSTTNVEGLDPLWMLNHFHFLDSGRDGKRPITFSRYAGVGSHRYPIGFSGDTVIDWKSLDFQVYFTGTASNIGYGWWSHDIGGHMAGSKDDELTLRWIQFGVFSPINRLHSDNNIFNGREPWRYREDIHQIMNRFLRLRHQLIPYLYTMNHKAYAEYLPLIRPMYYHYPENDEAYEIKNEYFFGTELIVAPITSPCIDRLNIAKSKVWLPAGTYIDFFTGTIYTGDRFVAMYRDLSTLPVLAKAGAIIPITDEISAKEMLNNPSLLTLRVFAGNNNSFTIYEDENDTQTYKEGKCATTKIDFSWNEKQKLLIHIPEGDLSLLPQTRSYTVTFIGITKAEAIVSVNGTVIYTESSYSVNTNILTVTLPALPIASEIEINFNAPLILAENHVKDQLYALIDRAEIEFDIKSEVYEKPLNEWLSPRGKDFRLLNNYDLIHACLEIIDAKKQFYSCT